MNKTIKLLFLSIAILFSACSVNNEFSTSKRKYNKGYHVDNVKKSKKNLVATKTVAVKKDKETETIVVTTRNNNVEEILVNKAVQGTILEAPKKSKSSIVEKPKTLKERIVRKQLAKIEKKLNKKSAHTDIDNETILLLILSLFPFLALIAMYMKDGNMITINFWVDLLLHLTIVGYAVFAVLVVLDFIDLS